MPDTAIITHSAGSPLLSACIYAAFILRIALSNAIRSAWTHEILRFTAGTSASSKDLTVTGKGFNFSLIKYLAPILYAADRSQLYCFPFANLQRLWFCGFRSTFPEPSYARMLVFHGQIRETLIPLRWARCVQTSCTVSFFHICRRCFRLP